MENDLQPPGFLLPFPPLPSGKFQITWKKVLWLNLYSEKGYPRQYLVSWRKRDFDYGTETLFNNSNNYPMIQILKSSGRHWLIKRQWDHVISIIVKPIIRDLQVRHKSSVATGCAGCGKPVGSIKEVTKALRTAHNIYSFALPRRTWDVWSCEKKPEEKLSSAKRTHGATGIADCFFSFFVCLLLISFNSRHKLSWWRGPSLRLHWEAFPFCLLPEKGMPDHVLSWYGLTSPLYAWSAVFSFLLWVYSLGGRRGRFFFSQGVLRP